MRCLRPGGGGGAMDEGGGWVAVRGLIASYHDQNVFHLTNACIRLVRG